MAEGGVVANITEEKAVDGDSIVTEVEEKASEKMDVIDDFLERSRRERQNELAQIQRETRPVTSAGSRQNIGQFLAKNLAIRENVTAAQASGKQNVPLNTADVEEHRPEAVVIEIQGVSQQQRVSSMLQTSTFRRHLENIIRGSFRSVSNHSPSPSNHASSSNSTPARGSTPAPEPTPVNRPSPPVNRASPPIIVSQRRDSVSSQSTQSSGISMPPAPPVPSNVRIHDPRGLLGSVLAPEPTESRVIGNWANVEELQQETLVQEVSELVHRRLVTTALEGEFRNVLELHVRQHLDNTGTDGERVQEFIRSIPQSQPVIHNDFSNLGLPPPPDNWDNVSITSVSATAVPYTQTNLHMSREIASLKAQLMEMKNMMQISFNLQMDIQRSIRQEVAAGIAAAAGGTGAQGISEETTPKTAIRSTPINDTHCLICLDQHSDSVLYQCGHMCVCYACGRHLMDRGAKCPVCRAPIRDIIRAYKCNQD